MVLHERRSVLGVHWKYWCWSWNSKTLATWCKELTHLKRSWCWERLRPGGEGHNGGWNGWMASLTQWTWVWVNSGSWWWTGRAWRAVVHGVAKSCTWLSDWTELNWWLVLWYSRVLESVLLVQRLRVWSLVRNEDSTSEIKTNTPKWEAKDEPQKMVVTKSG